MNPGSAPRTRHSRIWVIGLSVIALFVSCAFVVVWSARNSTPVSRESSTAEDKPLARTVTANDPEATHSQQTGTSRSRVLGNRRVFDSKQTGTRHDLRTFRSLTFPVQVDMKGKPVKGTAVGAEALRGEGEGGLGDPDVIARVSSDLLTSPDSVLTDANGRLNARSSYVVSAPGGTSYVVVAIHPLLGTAHRVVSLDTLRSGEAVGLELSKQLTISGVLRHEHGEPVQNATVELCVQWHEDSLSMEGLTAVTDEKGHLSLVGISLEGNQPLGLRIRFAPGDTAGSGRGDSAPTEELFVPIDSERFAGEAAEWNLGTINIVEAAMRQRGERPRRIRNARRVAAPKHADLPRSQDAAERESGSGNLEDS